MGDSFEIVGMETGGEQRVEGDDGSGSSELLHLLEGLQGVVEHGGASVGSDERGEESLCFDKWVSLARLDQGLDVGEAVGFGEAADGELHGVARGEWG